MTPSQPDLRGVRFTLLGATGFAGGHLRTQLEHAGADLIVPGRDWTALAGQPLGHVIYAVGLTADFRTRPRETMDAHVGRLAEIIHIGGFESLLYLSSTRLYGKAASGREDASIPVDAADPSDLYTASKLAGEALTLALPAGVGRVARLSNLFGPPARFADGCEGRGMAPDTFLASVIAAARATGRVEVGQAAASAKDYAAVEDVAALLIAIACTGRQRLYNLASGVQTRHDVIAGALAATGAQVAFTEDAPRSAFPVIDVTRLRAEFGTVPRGLDAAAVTTLALRTPLRAPTS